MKTLSGVTLTYEAQKPKSAKTLNRQDSKVRENLLIAETQKCQIYYSPKSIRAKSILHVGMFNNPFVLLQFCQLAILSLRIVSFLYDIIRNGNNSA